MDRPLHSLSLREAVHGIKNGLFTSEAYTRALLEEIQMHDDAIRAWAWFDPEAALQAARDADRAPLPDGETSPPLRGRPIGIKDIYATAGIPTEMGSPAFSGNIPRISAVLIERMRRQGAFVMGKTVTTECAFYAPGKTRNPWNPLHTPGGSSSGSAAAVAAGFIPAALGTQTNGSVIRPAAYCGVVGFKPTQGILPIAGALTFSQTLDQPGVFTRGSEDAAWLAAALAPENSAFFPLAKEPGKAPRLAAVKSPVWEQADASAKQNFFKAIETLRGGGANVEECELPDIFNSAHAAIRTIMAAESAFNLGYLLGDHASQLSVTLRDFIIEGHGIGAVDYQRALSLRLRLQDELAIVLSGYDAIVTPPATGEAPATIEQTGSPTFCSIWSLCGVPAVTIPTGLGPGGLPRGLQIVGAAGDDSHLLSVARWCEVFFPFPSWKARCVG
jgi:Asp-tRNA(Asn)/Glu-tRNA(Gln) amidotransferase A subunit family amidase